MTAKEAQHKLGLTQPELGQRVLEWMDELRITPTRVVMLEEKLGPAALATRWHISEDVATRIIRTVQGRRKLSKKLLRAPASALEVFFRTKTLPKR